MEGQYSEARGYNFGIAKELGIDAAITFNQLVFWQRIKGSGKWFFKPYDEMLQELPLSIYQLKKAYVVLVEQGYIETIKKKVNGAPTLHFRILKNFVLEYQKTSYSINNKEHTIKNNTSLYITKRNVKDSSTEVDTTKQTLDNSASNLFYLLVKQLGFTEQVKYSAGRAAKLKRRLKTFTPEELEKAAKLLAADPFMSGSNDSNKRYGTIDYLLRNDENVDTWLTTTPKKNVF